MATDNLRVKPRLLVFIVAYHAEKTIEDVLGRIPHSLTEDCDVEVLIIDDSSTDRTFERSEAMRRSGGLPFKVHVLFNPKNQGYGGNQKIGFYFAIEQGFDFVALVHGDGQYAPECLPDLVKPLANGEADAVFGSRMIRRSDALKGGMPVYKLIGNMILTRFQNLLLRSDLSEFHSGYRIYSVDALRCLPFHLNSNAFHFDTEIIIQFLFANLRVKELSIPTYYGDEICYVNGMKYAWNVVKTTIRARAQELGVFYDRRFDCPPRYGANTQDAPKLDYESPHTLVLARVEPGGRVLDLGCGGGYLGSELRKRGCQVTDLDVDPLANGVHLDGVHSHDLNSTKLPTTLDDFEFVLLIDVLEQLLSPEKVLDQLREAGSLSHKTKFVVSTGNVAFVLTRLMLLVGQFNYGKRGILDVTHTRLFTFATVRRLFEQGGFEVLEMRGVPVPFPLALGNTRMARFLLAVNRGLIRLSKSLFAYQVFMVVRPWPSLAYLLSQARAEAKVRAERIGGEASGVASGINPRR